MGESFEKREKAKRKARKKQDKAEKMKERKANNDKGKSLDDMMAYLDEDGNITDTPPDGKVKRNNHVPENYTGVAMPREEEIERTGTVSFFNETKGFGFITDDKTRENIFVHANHLAQPVTEGDKVTFEKEKTPKGWSAIRVKKTIK